MRHLFTPTTQNLCLEKAQKSGIRVARLPIGRYLANFPTRKVLTVNQVFEILVHWAQTKDWEKALYSVMPKRKFQDGPADKPVASTTATKEKEEDVGTTVIEQKKEDVGPTGIEGKGEDVGPEEEAQ